MLLCNATCFRILQQINIRSTNVDQNSAATLTHNILGSHSVHMMLKFESPKENARSFAPWVLHVGIHLCLRSSLQPGWNVWELTWGHGVWEFGHPRIRAWTSPAWTSRMETMRLWHVVALEWWEHCDNIVIMGPICFKRMNLSCSR